MAVAIGREYYYLNYSAILFRQRRWKGFQFMNRSFTAILVLFAICVTPESRTITSQTKDGNAEQELMQLERDWENLSRGKKFDLDGRSSAATHQVNDEHNRRYDQKQMNESTANVSNQTQQPQHQ